jgi:hypothetical protein
MDDSAGANSQLNSVNASWVGVFMSGIWRDVHRCAFVCFEDAVCVCGSTVSPAGRLYGSAIFMLLLPALPWFCLNLV